MILKLDHIAIIAPSDETVHFYERMGFAVSDYTDRGYDKLYFLVGNGNGVTLEIFVDPTHPPRVDRPEAMGLRHLAFTVDNIEKTVCELGVEAEPIREKNGFRFTFVRDPGQTPIELREAISTERYE